MARASKGKRRKEVVPALGVVALSLSMAGGASAATTGQTTDVSLRDATPSPDITIGLHEEEVADISLTTFHVFDRESLFGEGSTAERLLGDVLSDELLGKVQMAGRCRGCRGCRGCRCGRGCGFGGCRCGCGGCGGCGCGGCRC